MDGATPMRGIRRGFRRRFWITLAISPVALISLGWIALASPLGRGWIAGKIRNRTGMELPPRDFLTHYSFRCCDQRIWGLDFLFTLPPGAV